MSSTPTFTSTALTWKQADDNVHVATRDGEFAGFVEASGAALLARDNHGTALGSFSSLPEARRALERSPRRATRSIGLALRRRLSRARS
ncbi:hypothetical protein [Microbacterium sp.]|uniref:hypothetical protein n=1 Tax=Microbacterium sp. TaxID=51671 RepID=UPI002606D891|nr:hypothetical protein [Microbacterium sp.]